MPNRVGSVERKTAETAITVRIDLDGTGQSRIQTPLPFLSHMLEQIARHGLFDLEVEASNPEQARAEVERMCAELLANPLIESYEIELVEDA